MMIGTMTIISATDSRSCKTRETVATSVSRRPGRTTATTTTARL